MTEISLWKKWCAAFIPSHIAYTYIKKTFWPLTLRPASGGGGDRYQQWPPPPEPGHLQLTHCQPLFHQNPEQTRGGGGRGRKTRGGRGLQQRTEEETAEWFTFDPAAFISYQRKVGPLWKKGTRPTAGQMDRMWCHNTAINSSSASENKVRKRETRAGEL